jgi:UDP-N-acetylglucosamine transferase subunit ALG13
MILFTIGTNEQPFDRLIRAARELEGDEPLLVQHGSSREPHGRGEWIDFLSFDELAERARSARVVVCHAGVGSIMLARRCGHRPVVVPRRHHLGEAVDDHQLFLAKRLAQSGIVTLVEDVADLPAVLAAPDAAAAAADSPLRGAGALSADVRAVLEGLGAPRLAA